MGYSTERVLKWVPTVPRNTRESTEGKAVFLPPVAKFDTRQVATAIVDSQGVEEKGRQTDIRAPSSHLHLAGLRTP